MQELTKLIQEFKQHGYKMTPQRRAIIQVIVDCTSCHPTAEQIHERVATRMPDVSLATVYNTLRELVAIGQVYELNLGQSVRRYEISRNEHAHLVCLNCDMIRDVPSDFTQIESVIRHRNGFHPVRHAITVFGYCAACAALRKN
jgi:Fur family transcriptional regulator, ferric uptake regulator